MLDTKKKSTFSSHHGLYRFIRMPVGLNKAPGTFQRVVDVILATVKWQWALLYLYDLNIIFETSFEHLDHVSSVLRPFRRQEAPFS